LLVTSQTKAFFIGTAVKHSISPSVIRIVKGITMKLAEHLKRMGEKRFVLNIGKGATRNLNTTVFMWIILKCVLYMIGWSRLDWCG
jgi:hypothetical protein